MYEESLDKKSGCDSGWGSQGLQGAHPLSSMGVSRGQSPAMAFAWRPNQSSAYLTHVGPSAYLSRHLNRKFATYLQILYAVVRYKPRELYLAQCRVCAIFSRVDIYPLAEGDPRSIEKRLCPDWNRNDSVQFISTHSV